MGYFNFKNNETPLNETNLKAMQIGLMKLVFPVGSTYITQTDVNPSTILEFGTWERVKGKVLVGLDENDADFNSIGKTGGEKEVALTVEQLASHDHLVYANSLEVQSGSGNWVVSYNQTDCNLWTQQKGEGKPHTNLQPYEVIGYMWKRTA